METGVVLAGGEGTRLLPATRAYNKHAAIVYDKPMVFYPIESLRQMGCSEIVVVSGPKGVKDLINVIGEANLGAKISYAIQEHEAGGTAEALGAVEGMVQGDFPVLCGDVYLAPTLPTVDEPTLYWHDFPEAHNHSVWNPETNEVLEKPIHDIGSRAIIAYVFDERVFEVIKSLEPSARGELEMVDLYRWYLAQGVQMKEYTGYFVDMGTPEGLFKVAERVRSETRRGAGL